MAQATFGYRDSTDNNTIKSISVGGDSLWAAYEAILALGQNIDGALFTGGVPNSNIWRTQRLVIPETIDVSDNIEIVASAEVLSLRESSQNRRDVILTQQITDNGAENPQMYSANARADTVIQSVDTGTSTVRSFSFTHTVTANRFIYEVIARAAENSDDVEVVIRNTDINGEIIDYKKNISVVSTGDMRVAVTNQFLQLTQGQVIHVTVSGALFKGDTSSGFVPYFAINSQTWTLQDLPSGTPIPQPGPNDFRYGLSAQSDPALVDFGSLTDVADPSDPQTVATGTTTAGQYFHIFSANTHDIQTIRDTVLDQLVYEEGGSGNIFTKVSDSRTESSVTYDAYSIGPLNAGVDESYIVRFS